MKIPEAFSNRMKKWLEPDEYQAFIASYDNMRAQGLRVNRLKICPDSFVQRVDWQLDPVPWTEDGFYYPDTFRPAKHPYYHAGLYYIQEPSAMAPAAILNPQPGEKVLDLCAAPGGKTTQLAAAMKGKGILVVNDNNPNRVKALVKNVELYGVTNAIVTNEIPDRLAEVFPGYFDRILVDAPCSGEGMFRKEPDMVKSWSEQAIEMCCGMQHDILKGAARMLRPGGWLLYSTCTFAPEENEQMIAKFLDEHPDFLVVPIPLYEGWEHGRPEWTLNAGADSRISGTARLWPHRVRGEGHYLALLQKRKDAVATSFSEYTPEKKWKRKELESFYVFVKETLPQWKGLVSGEFAVTMHEDRVFLSPVGLPSLKPLRLARQGWLLGTVKKNRFEPSQAFAMGLVKEDAARVIDFAADDPDVIRYVKGETVMRQVGKGWVLVCVDGFPLGWAKGAGNMLKNMYSAGWRWQDGA
ncbi:RsmB/NOP family class I SAM-dependent RNA methyltransferase [Aneurinibacillus thermoaerophilus]|uniref:RsmB/NOP family class I SAM-dependent RNA methyltransferase n=1 Tax=Aneurinibacillus thermoaerophilus TaxID=143495 RepID=A0ABX8YCV1_ANETH|nr:RsmB/NOP family class I SAM-dependent RNA methyltransferase [Aneurinibacillus thermoaerophilus]MED0678041.1 RsmB/NOP family class I SAM-dependent RNA methyltransferase [Aneurinibacillus thermoaerophilus]MED0737769.1 RsmB/NOP family class I SAM-dependent RNA methyltransferase [Aneurinibacillus thermoaerophilus]MED0764126.1 RsmB/NOP family class I SAM-dependent RNA methyltransferase [Aneurinibacillus thermoaerophilus]QYY43547.1 RsmB/NOP family class I SAM-dependent RNA methyltransferase [Aneur